MAKRKEIMPDYFQSTFSVEVPYYSQEYQSTDGSPVETEPILDALWEGRTKNPEPRGYVVYNGKVTRHDGKFTLKCEWVHLDGQGGTRITLPHEAVEALLRAVDSVKSSSRSARAIKGAETRKAKGFVPFKTTSKEGK